MIFRSVVSITEEYTAKCASRQELPMPFLTLFRHTAVMSMHLLLLGFGVGLVAILPPGPVSMSLIEVSVSHGRNGGARGGLGVASGDIVVATAAALVVLAGGAIPSWIFGTAQLVSSLVLISLGVVLFARPGLCHSLGQSIVHPGRTFFALTALTPTVFGAWLALIAAMPFATDPTSVATFIVGAGVASIGFHLLLGTAAGGLGQRLSPTKLAVVSRVGGAAMLSFGAWTLVG